MINFSTRAILVMVILTLVSATALANSVYKASDPLSVQPRGATVGAALLVEYFNALPEPSDDDTPRQFAERLNDALDKFKDQVKSKYTEGTLQRLLDTPDVETRRAAVLALSGLGTMRANPDLARRLRDNDILVRRLASDALWSIWYRADSEENAKELRRLMDVEDQAKAIAGLTKLIDKAPNFAEAVNQRAIRHYQNMDYKKSIADCEKALQLNPQHFGAASGLAQCHMNLKQYPEALKAYRQAYRLNPNMDGVKDAIRLLENALGDDGKK
jgi:tetratricopeptide (TPR) repeat protein